MAAVDNRIDARLSVVENDVKHIRSDIARNREEAAGHAATASASRDRMVASLDSLKEDLAQREGAAKLGQLLLMMASGSVGAGLIKLIAYLGASPVK